MAEIFHAFGVDWRLLLVQAVNFGLLLLILWQFLYKPLMRILDQRRVKIEEGVLSAQRAEEKLHKIESEKAGIIAAAAKEGEGLMERARKAASETESKLTDAAEAKADLILKSAESQIEDMRAQALRESKQELAKLIVLGAERVIREGKVK